MSDETAPSIMEMRYREAADCLELLPEADHATVIALLLQGWVMRSWMFSEDVKLEPPGLQNKVWRRRWVWFDTRKQLWRTDGQEKPTERHAPVISAATLQEILIIKGPYDDQA